MIRRTRNPRQTARWDATRRRVQARYTVNKEVDETMRIQDLPSPANIFHGFEPYEWGLTLKTLFVGVHDDGSILSCLHGKEQDLLAEIFSFVSPKFGGRVKLTLPAFAIGKPDISYLNLLFRFNHQRRSTSDRRDMRPQRLTVQELLTEAGENLEGLVSYVTVKSIQIFPQPSDRNINMMPFIFGDKDSLPEKYQDYFLLIEQCPYLDEEVGKVGYLTVHESYVEADTTQRRGGIHIETPGSFCNEEESSSAFSPGKEHCWGIGMMSGLDKLEGGIYMASTVANTCQVWDALVDKNAKGIVDRHGGCEHLRPLLGGSKILRANELIWMTDCTPHEALPQTVSGYRQFFRVVTSRISHWFADHSTPNPLVPLPPNVVVVHGSKFQS